MLNTLKILAYLVIGLTVMISCGTDKKEDILSPVESRAFLSVTVDPSSDPDNREVVNTVRLIVFGNVSTKPRLEANKYIELLSPEAATTIKVTDLEVLEGKDKIVVVIINEPQTGGYSLKPVLDGIESSSDLLKITYDIAELLNASGEGAIIATSGMPMIGVKRDIEVEAEQTTNVTMVVERAVSRVEIYLEPRTGVTTGYTAGSSTVTVKNISHDSYLVMGNAANGTRDNGASSYGMVKYSVDPAELKPITWTASAPAEWNSTDANKRRLLCYFYVAERIFRPDYSDRITISMAGFKRGDGTAGVTDQTIPHITDTNGITEDFREFRRNNVYQITAWVNQYDLLEISTISVKEWEMINVDLPIQD